MNPSYLEPNFNFDYNSESIQRLLRTIVDETEELSPRDFALRAYLHVRDNWPYNPYQLSLNEKDWTASEISTRKSGNCLDKAALLIAVLRAKGIPARLGLAKVKNHIAAEQIIEKFGNDVLVPHGYVEIYLDEKWVKATPAFDKTLCNRLGVEVLEFDGINDSLFQPYNSSGSEEFMEYLEDYGAFDNIPLPFMLDLLNKTYPRVRESKIKLGMVLNLDSLS